MQFSKQNHTHVNKMGHNSEFLFGVCWWIWKTNIYYQKLLKWANKKQNNFDIYKASFFFFLRNPPGDIIILHLCTKHLDDIIYSSWDAERDKLKLVFLGHFFPFYPLKNPKNQNFENKKKIAGDIIILHMFTKNHNYMMSGSWDTEWDKQDFLSFWAIFDLLLPPLTTRKIKILKKWEKFLEISFYTFAP